jgi:hypothetical protein
MIAPISLALKLLAAFFKPTSRLEGKMLAPATAHCAAAKGAWSQHFYNGDRVFFWFGPRDRANYSAGDIGTVARPESPGKQL